MITYKKFFLIITLFLHFLGDTGKINASSLSELASLVLGISVYSTLSKVIEKPSNEDIIKQKKDFEYFQLGCPVYTKSKPFLSFTPSKKFQEVDYIGSSLALVGFGGILYSSYKGLSFLYKYFFNDRFNDRLVNNKFYFCKV